MTRTRKTLTATALGLALALGAGAYAASAAPPDVTAETVALQQVGLAEADADAGAPQQRLGNARRFLRKNTMHGEVTVQAKDGAKTVVVQRGTVTAADGKTIGVKSADGFTLTWTLADKVRVRQDGKKADAGAVKAGATVGVAGVKDGSATTARLIRIG